MTREYAIVDIAGWVLETLGDLLDEVIASSELDVSKTATHCRIIGSERPCTQVSCLQATARNPRVEVGIGGSFIEFMGYHGEHPIDAWVPIW